MARMLLRVGCTILRFGRGAAFRWHGDWGWPDDVVVRRLRQCAGGAKLCSGLKEFTPRSCGDWKKRVPKIQCVLIKANALIFGVFRHVEGKRVAGGKHANLECYIVFCTGTSRSQRLSRQCGDGG